MCKRFAKTLISFVSWSRILTPKRFDSYRDWQIRLHRFANPDLRVQTLKIRIGGFDLWPEFQRFNLFSWIQWTLTNPDKSLGHRRTLNKPESIQILSFGFANPYCFQKICLLDLFCPPMFKRFDSYRFGRIRIRILQA